MNLFKIINCFLIESNIQIIIQNYLKLSIYYYTFEFGKTNCHGDGKEKNRKEETTGKATVSKGEGDE